MKQLFSFSLLLIFLIGMQMPSQGQTNIEWANRYGGSSNDDARTICADDFGNVYVMGYFGGTIDFDPSSTVNQLISHGLNDFFVQKFNAEGELIWVKQFGSTGDEYSNSNSLFIDQQGNLLITGSFSGTIDFDPGSGVKNITSAGETDIFLLKLSASGNLIWVKQMGGTAPDGGNSMITDSAGNIYLTGYFKETADFNPSGGGHDLNAIGYSDIFIEKLDSLGNLIWVKQFGGSSSCSAFAIDLDKHGNIYTTGYFEGTIDFDPGVNTFNMTRVGGYDVFILKINNNGEFIWAKSVGGTSSDAGTDIIVDDHGGVYVSGFFEYTVDFDPGQGNKDITVSSHREAFVLKLDGEGNYEWVNHFSGYASVIINDMRMDNAGAIYGIGNFRFTLDVINEQDTLSIPTNGSYDVVIFKMDSLGNRKWVKTLGGKYGETGAGISINSANQIYALTTLNDTCTYGDTVLYSLGGRDVAIIKLSQCYTGSLIPVPDSINLATINASCSSISEDDINIPTGRNACGTTLLAQANVSFPITDQSIERITWTYDDGHGNYAEQEQEIEWEVSIALANDNTELSVKSDGIASFKWLACDNGYNFLEGHIQPIFKPYLSGSYAVEINKTDCIDTSNCIYIDVNCYANFSSIFYPERNTFEILVDASTADYAQSYSWNFGDGFTSTSIAPNHTYNSDTTVQLCVTINTAQFISCSYCISLIGNNANTSTRATGFAVEVLNPHEEPLNTPNLHTLNSSIQISPNPSTGNFILSKTLAFNDAKVQVLNSLGIIVWEKNHVTGHELNLDLRDQVNGMYIVVIQEQGSRQQVKIMKQ